MKFDRNELDRLERHEQHLTILAAIIVLVLAGGVALLMYPLVFVRPDEGNKWPMRFAFIGFCVLCVLFVGYLLDRQRTVRKLKQHLLEELDRNVELRNQANVDLLHTIPDLNHFQDRLAMEFRRSATTEHKLSLIVVKTKLLRVAPDSNEGRMALGEAARAISRKLRPTDSIYLLASGIFGMVLPETETAIAKKIVARLDEVLRAVGGSNGFSLEISMFNYPDDVSSAHELDQKVSSLLPESEPWLAGVDAV